MQILHRGGNTEKYTENSLEIVTDFLTNNIYNNFQGIEIDIFQLHDGEFVCFHDKNMKRLTGINNNITNYTRNTLHNVKIKNGTLLFLSDLFYLMNKYNKTHIYVILDIKHITNKGCLILQNLINKSNIEHKYIHFTVYSIHIAKLLNKYFSNTSKCWYPLINKYTRLPNWILNIHNKYMNNVCKNWNGLSIGVFNKNDFNDQLHFYNDLKFLNLFGIDTITLNTKIKYFTKYNIKFIIVDYKEL